MMIKILNVEQLKNEKFIGEAYEVLETRLSNSGEACYMVKTKFGKRIFKISDCEVLENVLMLKRA